MTKTLLWLHELVDKKNDTNYGNFICKIDTFSHFPNEMTQGHTIFFGPLKRIGGEKAKKKRNFKSVLIRSKVLLLSWEGGPCVRAAGKTSMGSPFFVSAFESPSWAFNPAWLSFSSSFPLVQFIICHHGRVHFLPSFHRIFPRIIAQILHSSMFDIDALRVRRNWWFCCFLLASDRKIE